MDSSIVPIKIAKQKFGTSITKVSLPALLLLIFLVPNSQNMSTPAESPELWQDTISPSRVKGKA